MLRVHSARFSRFCKINIHFKWTVKKEFLFRLAIACGCCRCEFTIKYRSEAAWFLSQQIEGTKNVGIPGHASDFLIS